MSNRSLRSLAWATAVFSLVCYMAATVLLAMLPLAKIGPHSPLWPVDPADIGLLVYVVVGLLILIHHPRHLVGWLFLFIGFTRFFFDISNAYILYAKLVDPRLPVDQLVLFLPTRMWILTFFASPLLLVIFPNGRLLSPRWRWLVWLVVVINLLMLVSNGSLIEAGSYSFEMTPLLTQLGLGNLTALIQDIGTDILILTLIAVLINVWLRFRRSKGEERLQLKWFSFAALAFVLVNLIVDFGFFNGLTNLDPSAKVPADLFLGIPSAASFAFIPLGAAVAILRYHLYDIDIIIRKTLIYGALTATLALIYAGSVIVLQSIVRALTGEGESPVAIVLSTLAIASLFNPLRQRFQGWIDKRFYRRRYDAEKVLAAFSATARDDVDLDRLTAHFMGVVDQTMQPQSLSLWMRENERR